MHNDKGTLITSFTKIIIIIKYQAKLNARIPVLHVSQQKEPGYLSKRKDTLITSYTCELVWPSGKADKQKGLGVILLRLSFLFKSCDLWTLSCDCPSQLMKH